MDHSEKKVAVDLGSTVEMTQLLAYRLHKVANQISRSAAMRYRREFDLSLWEWRTIALLGGRGAMSLNELAKIAGLDKGQVSRVASGLTSRGMVLREVNEIDTRKISLSLTPTGQKIYKRLNRVSNQRNTEFTECLSLSERNSLNGLLEKLERKARELIAKEREAGN
ncbi:winged helix-turn-helix transcriptional regulator [Allopusillimonas ginsengisoli]|nr:winged helix-turn-helix transcriptional regulator [Allopusillimonas ginsengisoli]